MKRAILMALLLSACSGTTKLMKNCKHIANEVYECEEVR